jgi:hypothetical protein
MKVPLNPRGGGGGGENRDKERKEIRREKRQS